MENKLLHVPYDGFCIIPKLLAERQAFEKCHITSGTSIDSFISGFQLARKPATELNHYENERPVSCRTGKKLGAHFNVSLARGVVYSAVNDRR